MNSHKNHCGLDIWLSERKKEKKMLADFNSYEKD